MPDNDLLLLISLGANGVLAALAARKINIPGAASLTVLTSCLALWSAFHLLFSNAAAGTATSITSAILYIFLTVAASAELIFAISYRERHYRITPILLILLGITPVLTQLLHWAGSMRAFMPSERVGWLAFLLPLSEAWVKINSLYIFVLVSASLVLMVNPFVIRPRPMPIRTWAIIIGSGFPFILQALAVLGLSSTPQTETILFGFTLAALGFSYGTYGDGSFELVPMTRGTVVEGMHDGWIVLDAHDTIVDINPAAEQMIGLLREKIYGKSIQSVLSDFPAPGKSPSGMKELEMRRSLKSENGFKTLNIRISPLVDREKHQYGHLVLWRDDTERRLAEGARQRAREEMFVLLNTIASAASNALSLEDFLSESIYLILYPFRCQAVAIYLIDEKSKKEEALRLSLASHFGLPAPALKGLSRLSLAAPLFEFAYKNRQPLLIENTRDDARLPSAIREMDYGSFLVIPLITQAGEERQTLGFICLGRKEKPGYSPDEVIRLTAISEQIATLIDSDRRRKLAIALTERKRLERDLHDSVMQKLYGLVTLSEAAQAAVEAGGKLDPFEIITKIGQNARQAVREMRLFLYQPQPVDVAKDGLIPTLHHRLAAVEGRADIKTRFLADDKISLSKEKEVALYFIAQEALNNALRHAHARSVEISLKEGYRNVILEIVDNGSGFDPKNVKRGGLGLRNMKERAALMDGKITISSQARKGTKIVVTVPKDAEIREK